MADFVIGRHFPFFGSENFFSFWSHQDLISSLIEIVRRHVISICSRSIQGGFVYEVL